jgi:DTW domain-containing protein YfiP
MSLDGPVCSKCLILEQYCICDISPEIRQAAEEALKRTALPDEEWIPRLAAELATLKD